MVVAGGEFIGKQPADVVLEDVEVAVEIVAELLLQGGKLSCRIGGVPFKLSHLLECGKRLLALAVVGEVRSLDSLLESKEQAVVYLKLLDGSNSGMVACEVGSEVEQDITVSQVEQQVGQAFGSNLHIGSYATALVHGTSRESIERGLHAVGLAILLVSCRTLFRIVNLLYATSRGGVVLCGCNLKRCVIG